MTHFCFVGDWRIDNVSFVLVYRESPEENYILRLGFPLFYSQENLRIYKVPESVKTT